jgi:ribosome-binding ATPase
MSLKIGIVGLPNVGKSTLFNALVKSSVAEAANYPFCTIEPNVGIVDIPDAKLAEVAKSAKIVPAAIEFVDIAGLVKGASQGEGLGNKFLSHIREVDAIILVLRGFNDSNVINTQDTVDPVRDAKIIDLELILADLETVTKRQETIQKDVRSGKEEARILSEAMTKAIAALEAEVPLRQIATSSSVRKFLANPSSRVAQIDPPAVGSRNDMPLLTDKEEESLKQLSLLTLKPLMVVLNVDENDVRTPPAVDLPYPIIPVSAKIESEIAQLSPADAQEFMADLGMEESGLDKVAQAAYNLLGLQSYYTAGEQEARAWTIKQGSTAPQAAGVIHTDFERGFIAAEVISYQDFITLGGWSGGRPAGKVRTEGKTYAMQPDDVVLFRFNV